MASSGRKWGVWVVVGLVIALPILEVVVLIATGRLIGAWPTIGLMLATSLLGAWLAQHEGRRAWTALRRAFAENRMPTGELADAVLIMVGGLFLMLPGFVSDVIGLICLLPITRPLGRRLLSWVVSRAATNRGIDLRTLANQARIIQDPSSVIRGETVPDFQQPQQNPVIRGEVED